MGWIARLHEMANGLLFSMDKQQTTDDRRQIECEIEINSDDLVYAHPKCSHGYQRRKGNETTNKLVKRGRKQKQTQGIE